MTRTRMTAAERSEQMVNAAITAFATTGYAGTTTDDVARLAGVSQPYVLRLFSSKRELFIVAFEQACSRVEQTFRAATQDTPGLPGLATAYRRLLAEPELLGLLLHGYAACSDEAIATVVRRRFGRIYRAVRELTDASPDEVRMFLANGMLFTVLAAMRIIGPDAVPPEPWMTELIRSFPPSSEAGRQGSGTKKK
jgi:AcrR family transcriptional regulator